MGFVTDVRTGAYDVLVDLQAANETILGEVHRSRPASFALALPVAFVGDFRASIHQTVQLRQWNENGTEVDIWFVMTAWDNAEQQEMADTLVDAFLAAWPTDGHFVENAVGDPVRLRTDAIQIGDGTYPAVVVTVGRIAHLEAR